MTRSSLRIVATFSPRASAAFWLNIAGSQRRLGDAQGAHMSLTAASKARRRQFFYGCPPYGPLVSYYARHAPGHIIYAPIRDHEAAA